MCKSLREPLLSCEILEGVNFRVWISIHSPSLWDTVPGRQEGCLSNHHQGHCPVLDSERWCAIFDVTLDWSCMKPLTKAPTQSMPGFPGCQDISRYVKICQERTASNWVRWSTATPQVEVEDFVKRAKSLTKEIEELWLMEWGDAQGEMIWRWLSKTCFLTNKTDKTWN